MRIVSLILCALCLPSAQANPMQQSAKHLLHAVENTSYDPSPVKTPNQWQYARIARTHPNAAGMFPLLAGNAEIKGTGASYNHDHDIILPWTDKKTSLAWHMASVPRSTKYDIYAHYKANGKSPGNTFKIALNNQTLRQTVQNTGNQFKPHKIGTLTLKKGTELQLTLAAENIKSGSNLFELKAIEVVPQKSQHRWFDTARLSWRNDIPSYLRYGSKTPDQAPPLHLVKGGPKGYVVITTEAIRQNSKELANFITHKQSLGYTTYIATEKDFGKGKGPDAFHNIRNWLRNNYQTKNLLYALMIGRPHPDSGEIPMGANETDMVKFKQEIAAGKHPHAKRATDLFYADLNGPTVDLNKNNLYGDDGDFHPTDGLNTVPEILVGRIPYYGEDSKWGKYADVDAILRKTINYENATYAELLERYRFEVDGMVLDAHTVEWAGATYYTREQLYSGPLTTDHFSWQNNSFMNQFSPGFLRSGGHANPTYIESGVTSGWLAQRIPPKDTLNVLAVYGGCDCAQPEHPMNMVYMHLRKGAITSIGASRSVASVRGHRQFVRPNALYETRNGSLMTGQSVGQMHWVGLAGGRRLPNGGAKMWTLYGDPSIVPFPQKLNPKRIGMVIPSHDLEHFQPHDNDGKPFKLEYDLHNQSNKAQDWSVQCSQDWLSIKTPHQGTIPANEKITLYTTINSQSHNLPIGRHKATIQINIGDQTFTRNIEYERFAPSLVKTFNFANQPKGTLQPHQTNKDTPIYSGETRSSLANLLDNTITFEIHPHQKITSHNTILTGKQFNLKINPSDQALHLTWEPHKYGDYDWNYRYYDINHGGKETIRINGTSSLRQKQWNQVTLVRDYTNQRIALYLNGKLEGHAKLPATMLYDLYRGAIPKGMNAAIDNFTIHRGAHTPTQIASNYHKGTPVGTPTPSLGYPAASRRPVLKWEMPESHFSFSKPTYYIYLSTNREDVAAKKPLKQFIAGKTTDQQFQLRKTLQPNQTYFWKVYAMSPDRKKIKGSNIWNFTTGRAISRQILASTDFKQGHQWTRGNITGNGIAEFKSHGDSIIQPLDKKSLRNGYYRVSLQASTHEKKPTKPIILSILGDGKEIFSHRIELNNLVNDQLDTYFAFNQPTSRYNKLELKLALPGSGGRCPYWVFASKLEIHNNIDPNAIPNRAPQFTQQRIKLPAMKPKDNSYAYFFSKIISDESPETVTYSMIEGPSWVTVQPNGRVFSYYGAPQEAKGEHRLIVQATDQQGLSSRATYTLVVE